MATHSIHLADPDLQPVAKPSRRRGDGPRLVIAALAAAVLVAAVLVLGLDGLIPFGLLLAFSTDSDEEETRRSVILTRRNLGLAAAMVGGLRLVLAVASRPDRVDARADRRGADRPAARAPGVRRRRRRVSAPSRSPSAASSWPSGGWWSSSTSTTRTGRASTCWRRCASCCRSCWRRRGHGAPAEGGSSSGCSATRFAERCDPTWCRASTSGCAARCSVESWPPVARTSRGSGSP